MDYDSTWTLLRYQSLKSLNMENLSIISILGGPGSGKGTQCEELCKVYSICHISVGDVLREETKRKDSPYAKLITRNIKEGKIGPKEMTVGLMKNKIKEKAADGVHVFLLDGETDLTRGKARLIV